MTKTFSYLSKSSFMRHSVSTPNRTVQGKRDLLSLIVAEDCATRCLVKPEETEETNASELQQTKNDEGDSGKAKTNDDEGENPDDDKTKKNSGGKSQYKKDKEKNIAQIKEILADLDAQYPMPEELT